MTRSIRARVRGSGAAASASARQPSSVACVSETNSANLASQSERHSGGSGTRQGMVPTNGYRVSQRGHRSELATRSSAPSAQRGQASPAVMSGVKDMGLW